MMNGRRGFGGRGFRIDDPSLLPYTLGSLSLGQPLYDPNGTTGGMQMPSWNPAMPGSMGGGSWDPGAGGGVGDLVGRMGPNYNPADPLRSLTGGGGRMGGAMPAAGFQPPDWGALLGGATQPGGMNNWQPGQQLGGMPPQRLGPMPGNDWLGAGPQGLGGMVTLGSLAGGNRRRGF